MSTGEDLSVEDIKKKIRRALSKEAESAADSALTGEISGGGIESRQPEMIARASTTVSGRDTSHSQRVRGFLKRIPVLGALLWWLYMMLKAPMKVTQLFAETEWLRARHAEYYSELRILRGKNQLLTAKMNDLTRGIEALRNGCNSVEEQFRKSCRNGKPDDAQE